MREKQIEEIAKIIDEYTEPLSARDIHKADFSEKFAYHLIENGVILLPCKVGDTVYDSFGKPIKITGVGLQSIYRAVIEIPNEDIFGRTTEPMLLPIDFDNLAIGETVFLTREEAERKLKERK